MAETCLKKQGNQFASYWFTLVTDPVQWMCWSWRSTLGWPICSHHNLRGLSQEPPQLPVPLAWPGTVWQPCALLVPGLWYVGGGSQLDLRKVSAKTLNDLLPGKLPRPPVLNAFLRELRGPSQTGRGVHVRDLGESLCFPSTHPTVRTMLCFLFWATCNRYFLICSTDWKWGQKWWSRSQKGPLAAV